MRQTHVHIKGRARLAGTLTALALIGGSLVPSSSVTAQTAPVSGIQSGSDFSVTWPNILTYYQQHGGQRTFGQTLSHDFQLLGRRVQIFERGVIEQRPNGTVQMMDVLGEGLALTHAAGATFPGPDPDLTATEPPLSSPLYPTQSMAAIDGGLLDTAAPDTWNGLPVGFGNTFHAAVTCADLPSTQPCDDRLLLMSAVDMWGLPTSAPTVDPNNPDLVYLRFQRGIMQFSQSAATTTAVPIGAWFKQVLIGTNLPDDLAQDVVGSRFYAQYAPSLGLGLARPSDLPATSLANAFTPSSTLASAGAPLAADPTGTPVFAPALPTFTTPTPSAATSVPSIGQPQQPSPQPTSPFAFFIPTVATGTASATPTVGTLAAGVATPAAPTGPDPCAGDEQILFAPKKPYVGTDALVAVTSATHHDVRTVRLTGPVKPGPVSERAGLNGWVWEWTISPAIDGWYEFTFYVDDARACATSGFNALPAFGATAAPTATATAVPFVALTATPTPTATSTATPMAAPAIATSGAADPPAGACAGRLLRLSGTNFGATQSLLNGNVLFAGPGGAIVATILSWTNSTILLTVPVGVPGGNVQIVVTTSAGASNPLSYQVGSC